MIFTLKVFSILQLYNNAKWIKLSWEKSGRIFPISKSNRSSMLILILQTDFRKYFSTWSCYLEYKFNFFALKILFKSKNQYGASICLRDFTFYFAFPITWESIWRGDLNSKLVCFRQGSRNVANFAETL